ncbi:MAG: hypothetical protein AB8H86_24545 [Polyangiales bacterium]
MNRASLVFAFSILGGCYQSVTVDAPPDAARRDAGLDAIRFDVAFPDVPPVDAGPLPTNQVDLVFVIDDSGGMGEEQAFLAAELPSLLTELLSGSGDVPPVPSLHVGFVSTNMGSHEYSVPTCNDSRDGLLTNSDCMWSDSGLFMDIDGVGELEEAACTAGNFGDSGCGYEQPLEAMLKALTPTGSSIRFFDDTRGHGDLHAGFLRPGAQLAVVVLANEDDCSAMDSEIYNSSSGRFTPDLNLRCAFHEEALHPIERYIDGLLAVVPASRLTFATITGIPVDVQNLDYTEILNDPRMAPRRDPEEPTALAPSCEASRRGPAFPPRRLLQVAQGLEARGAQATNISICQNDYGQFVEFIAQRLR